MRHPPTLFCVGGVRKQRVFERLCAESRRDSVECARRARVARDNVRERDAREPDSIARDSAARARSNWSARYNARELDDAVLIQ